jgi:hypothetical protein
VGKFVDAGADKEVVSEHYAGSVRTG